MNHENARKTAGMLILTFLAAALVCGCQQIDSIDDQQDEVAQFAQYSSADKNELIEDWYEMIVIEKIRESDSHCCYVRYQHALKNLARLIRDGKYMKSNAIRYSRMIDEYFSIANSSTDLRFMTDCLEDSSGAEAEITNIRKVAIASLVDLEDDAIFSRILEKYSDSGYEYPVQVIMADGLIKYLSAHKSDNICAEIITKSMILKQRRQNYAEMKEIEHLTGKCVYFASLNEAIRRAKNNISILELVLELNLNYWRKVQKENLDFTEKDALENIALMKALVMPAASKKIEELVYFTLCEVVPAESLVVLNSKMEANPSFENMKNMLSFYCSLRSINISSDTNLSKLTNTGKAINACHKLAKEFIYSKLSSLSPAEQKESYELYAKNLPDQAYEFLCRKFVEGRESVSFYETAVNAALWMTAQKIFKGTQASDVEKAIDKLLFSCRGRSDYRSIFELVYANKTTYLNQWNEMTNAAAKSDVKQKDAFIDGFVTLIAKINGSKKQQRPHDFDKKNHAVFEYIIASADAGAVLKLIPYLESCKDQKFLLEKYYVHTFANRKLNSSLAHAAVAGDIASRYITDLKANKKLYEAYKKLFIDNISSKDNDLSLLCADYYFRLIDTGDKSALERGKREFSARWPHLRPVVPNKKN